MLGFNAIVFIALAYVVMLFAVAFYADRKARRTGGAWLRGPWIYTLSLSVYCTAWTFYGAVGNAARSGLEYLTIYLGPTLVFLGWWWILRKLVRIGRAERITSIADLVSSRYGKSSAVAVLVTILAVVGSTPYISLQLQSVTLSFVVFSGSTDQGQISELLVNDRANVNRIAFWVSVGLAIFTILFGTRNLDTNERHYGVVTAIAVEAVVKLVALIAVGAFVVWGVSGGIPQTLDIIANSPVGEWRPEPSRWIGLTFLSAVAIICLPRMFQVMVVEQSDESHLATASWAFPLYLMAISLFVLPIAAIGLAILPDGANPDLFVLTLPLEMERDWLATLAFLGGFSSATSMVIVAAIALSTMVSNHIVIPLWLASRAGGATVSGDVRSVVLMSRRVSIAAIVALGYIYYRLTDGSTALSAIGLVSFAGVAQVMPALMAALFWRGATRRGAIAGLVTGFAVWAYTLLLPAVGAFSAEMLTFGPAGLEILRPQALFGFTGMDSLVHAIFWSIGLNTLAFLVVSLVTFPSPLERLQGASFVNVFERSGGARGWSGGVAATEDLLVMTQRLLGAKEAQNMFHKAAVEQGKTSGLPDPTPDFVNVLERELAGSVGAATAHAMIGQINGQASVSVQDLLAVADESAQMLEYSSQLEEKSRELEQTARQLRDANEKLTALSVQKDAFLSQISHELRTPMTSIRSFSEFLQEGDMPEKERARYSQIIHNESIRLTRLLDDLLDLTVLENGQVELHIGPATLRELIDRAVAATGAEHLAIDRDPAGEEVVFNTDSDRMTQVFINLISNAAKYCDAEKPRLKIAVQASDHMIEIDFIDNGSGVPKDKESIIFEKFARASDQSAAGSAGLGLAISREILARLGGEIRYIGGRDGAAFRVSIYLEQDSLAAE